MGYPDQYANYYSRGHFSTNSCGEVSYPEISCTKPVFDEATYDDIEIVQDGLWDLRPDIYNINVNGISTSFIIPPPANGVPSGYLPVVMKEEIGIEISALYSGGNGGEIVDFIVTDQHGLTYTFDLRETTVIETNASDPQGAILPPATFTSSWYLTEISAPVIQEKLTFNYKTTNLFNTTDGYSLPVNFDEYETYSQTPTELFSQCSPSGNNGGSYNSGSNGYATSAPIKIYNRRFLRNIQLKLFGNIQESIVFSSDEHNENPGLTDLKLTDLYLKDRADNNLLTWSFTYQSGSSTPNRLALEEFQELGGGGTLSKPAYTFDYYSGSLPDFNSNGFDHWGYYNGANGNQNLIPNVNISGMNIPGGGANRHPNFNSTKKGVMYKITYPTGGSTNFEFELNTADGFDGFEIDPGGLRVKKATNRDADDFFIDGKYYTYFNGRQFSRLRYSETIQTVNYVTPCCLQCNQDDIIICSTVTVSGSSNDPIQTVNGSHVGYSRVEVSPFTSYSNVSEIGKSIFHYTNSSLPELYYLGDLSNGQLLLQEVKDVNDITLKYTSNAYEEVNYNEGYNINFFRPSDCQANKDYLCYNGTWCTLDFVNGCQTSCTAGAIQKTEFLADVYGASKKRVRLTSSTTTDVFVNNGVSNSVSKSTSYVYDNDQVTSPTEMTFTGPGVNYTTRVKYSSDISGHCLNNSHMYATIIETKKYNGTALIGGTRVEYDVPNSPIICSLPKEYYNILSNGNEIKVAEVLGYSAGFPTGYQRYPSDNTDFLHPETYMWENGNIKTITVANQTQTFNYYPDWKQVEEIIAADGTQVYYEYDDLQRLEITKSKYDHGSGVYQVESINGYEYSPNKVSSTTNFIGDNTIPSQTSFQTFDGIGRSLTTVVNGILKNEVQYDAYGRVEYQTYLPGSFKQLIYQPNPLGRVEREIYPDNSSISIIYDAEGGYKNTVIDENGHPSISVTDILGRTLRVEDALGNITYYEYDYKGNLKTVKPPNFLEVGEAYEYDYDDRNRLIEKIIPGGATHTYDYNEADMMVGADNGNGNIVTKYDLFGRPVETGFGSFTAPDIYNITEYLTETFYDNPILVSSFPNSSKSTSNDCSSTASLGKVVGTKVKILEESGWIYTTTCYDQYGRSIVSNSTNHLDGNDQVTSTLNLADLPTLIEREHNVFGIPTTEILESFTYDGQLRNQSASHQIGDLPANNMTINFNVYNNTDQLLSKRIGAHPSQGIDFLQDIDYKYNARGWLTHINDVESTPGNEAIDACNEVIDCPPECTYINLVDFGTSDKFSNYITDITYIKWNVPFSIPLAYPYEIKTDYALSVNELNRLYADLNNWLNTEAYPAQSIVYSVVNGQLKIIINQTKTEFEKIFTTIGLEGSSNPGVGNNPPIGRVWEQDCETPSDNCKECYEIYKTCPCPLSFTEITPTKIRVEYDHPALTGTDITPSLLRITETGIYTNIDGITFSADKTSVRAVRSINAGGDLDAALGLGEDIPLTGNYTHVMEIDLANNDAVDFSSFKNQVGTMLANEINSAGISSLASDEMEATIMEATAETWYEELLIVPSASGNSPANNPQLFAMELVYGNVHEMVDALPQHNGNISGMIWKTAGRTTQSYSFLYDDINRLIDGRHQEDIGEDDYVQNNYNVEMTYDNMGNIQTLFRNGVIDRGICPEDPTMNGYTFGRMDSLEYSYRDKVTGDMTNRLQQVDEYTNTEYGYKGNGGGYEYDGNGNITRDHNKGVSIGYNHLNLPKSFTFDAGGSITITYDAAGIKLKKEVQGQENYTLHYIGGIEYREEADIEIESIHHAEGRVTYDENDEAVYEYHLKDHLGNVRMAFADKDGDGYIEPFSVNPNEPNAGGDGAGWNLTDTEILQESHYYPFGMAMDGEWQNIVNGPENNYLYNGKELNTDFGLDWSDYGARWYDASIGRWNAVDPLGEKYADVSSYCYVANMPTIAIDPDGQQIAIVGNDDYKKQVVFELAKLAAGSNTGEQLVVDAIRSSKTLVISNTQEGLSEGHLEKPPGKDYNILHFNLTSAAKGAKEINGTLGTTFAHEISHFLSNTSGRIFDKDGYAVVSKHGDPISADEVNAVEKENQVRSELGLPPRTHYGGLYVYGKGIKEKTITKGDNVYVGYALVNKKNYAKSSGNPTNGNTFYHFYFHEADVRITATSDYSTNFGKLRTFLAKPFPQTQLIISEKQK